MKVYVMTEAELFMPEKYVGVKANKKAAEKAFRDKYPYMRKEENNASQCKCPIESYVSDNSGKPTLLFIREEEI